MRKNMLSTYFKKSEIVLWCVGESLWTGAYDSVQYSIRNPYEENKAEVKVNRITLRETIFLHFFMS